MLWKHTFYFKSFLILYLWIVINITKAANLKNKGDDIESDNIQFNNSFDILNDLAQQQQIIPTSTLRGIVPIEEFSKPTSTQLTFLEHTITITAKMPTQSISTDNDKNQKMNAKNLNSNNNSSNIESDKDNNEKNESQYQEKIETLREKDPIGTSTMFVVGLITTSLNFVACGYLLYLVNKLRKRVGFHLTLRILVYTALVDILVGGFFTLSIVYSTLFDSLITGSSCQFIGFIINTFEATDMLLIGFLAVSTCTKAIWGYEIPTGRYDISLLTFILGCPLAATSILAMYHAFGPEEFWCLIDDETMAGTISTIGLLSLFFVVVAIVIICYIMVLIHKRKQLVLTVNNNNNGSNNNNLPYYQASTLRDSIASYETKDTQNPTLARKFYNQVHRRSVITLDYAELKLETHLKIHFFQYTPPTFHLICMLLGYKTSWVFTLAILSTNLSGVFQLLAYLHHQRQKKSQFKEMHRQTLLEHGFESPTTNDKDPNNPHYKISLTERFELEELAKSAVKSTSPTKPPKKSILPPLRNASYTMPNGLASNSTMMSYALPYLKSDSKNALNHKASEQTLLSMIDPLKLDTKRST